MAPWLGKYVHWLHTRWPAGHVERLPQINEDGSTAVAGLYVVGDVAGIPLLKFAAHTGARAVLTIVADAGFQRRDPGATHDGQHILDLVIVGGGVAGMAAAIEAKKHGLRFEILEATEPFSTLVNFPKGKPIFTYPTDMTPAGDLQFTGDTNVKESLLASLKGQAEAAGIKPRHVRASQVARSGSMLAVLTDGEERLLAHRVIIAIGRSGNFRKLGIPGEDLDKVSNRLHDPKDFCRQDVAVVGGGDSALECAIALASCGARATLSYRKPEFSRPKPENIERLQALLADGSIQLMMASRVKEIREGEIVITDAEGTDQTRPNDAVFAMVGREPPLDFFRRSGVPIRGEWHASTYVGFALFLAFCTFLYHWKKDIGLPVHRWFADNGWFPFNVPVLLDSISGAWSQAAGQSTSLLYTMRMSMGQPDFYYALAYCLCVLIFGIRRIRRRNTPYVTVQTWVLILIQFIPLFVLPEILLPWMGRNGWFADGGTLSWLADQFFERYDVAGHERAYWRAYGFILAWPLFPWNAFTATPMWGWIVLGSIQTFVLIPLIIWKWGKGAYCGWICSCGALAETLGDAHRHKMPHGPLWNRLNMVGQVILVVAVLLMLARVIGWIFPDSFMVAIYEKGLGVKGHLPFLNYKWFVDLFLAGIVGVGCYFWFSGRVWCRFACPLAALMHIYTRFSRFRILADKKKCISCNVCTSVCHQGIDVMNFANKGLPMEDPQCVRCSACVQSCPTGVLTFGQINRQTGEVLCTDQLAASPVKMAELKATTEATNDEN